MNTSTLTERGQISVPAELRKSLGLRPGQHFSWEKISDRELRVTVENKSPAGPLVALGYVKNFQRAPRSTASWMDELRAGEK